jgi:hypothetical protein
VRRRLKRKCNFAFLRQAGMVVYICNSITEKVEVAEW